MKIYTWKIVSNSGRVLIYKTRDKIEAIQIGIKHFGLNCFKEVQPYNTQKQRLKADKIIHV